MEPRQKFFIYERKEFLILLLLGIMVALFAFTLGVHFGKSIGGAAHVQSGGAGHDETTTAGTSEDKLPSRQEITDLSKDIKENVESVVEHATHTEVGRKGLKMEHPKPVQLPSETKAETSEAAAEPEKSAEKPTEKATEKQSVASGRFTIQVGSYPNLEEAEKRVEELKHAELEAFFHVAEVKDKRWYRVYAGEYASKEEAQSAGDTLKKKNLIASYLITKNPATK